MNWRMYLSKSLNLHLLKRNSHLSSSFAKELLTSFEMRCNMLQIWRYTKLYWCTFERTFLEQFCGMMRNEEDEEKKIMLDFCRAGKNLRVASSKDINVGCWHWCYQYNWLLTLVLPIQLVNNWITLVLPIQLVTYFCLWLQSTLCSK